MLHRDANLDLDHQHEPLADAVGQPETSAVEKTSSVELMIRLEACSPSFSSTGSGSSPVRKQVCLIFNDRI
jgi:hypothetical protein